LFSLSLATKINRLDAPKTFALEKLVSQIKSGKAKGNETTMLNALVPFVCPTEICCILIWNNNAPTDILSTPPCSSNVLYRSIDATVASCNVIADTTNTPSYQSSHCDLTTITFTALAGAKTCQATTSNDVCVVGTDTTPSGLNIGPDSTICTSSPTVGACDCNGGVSGGCHYPTSTIAEVCSNNWVSWIGSGSQSTIEGTIPDGVGGSITVTVSAPSSVNVDTDGEYWQSTDCSGNKVPAVAPTSPYTAALGEVAPSGTFLQNCDAQTFTVTFSKITPCPPTIAFISFNGNAAYFDQDFQIASQTGDPCNANKFCGYWGCGIIARVYDTSEDPAHPYHAVAEDNEPHFKLVLTQQVLTFSFTVIVAETWNGFTIGY